MRGARARRAVRRGAAPLRRARRRHLLCGPPNGAATAVLQRTNLGIQGEARGEKKRTDIGARRAARRMRRGSVLVGVLLPLMLAAPARAFKFVLPLRSALGAALLLPV